MKPIPFLLLDDTRTTYGVTVLVDGVDTEQFEVNPVMFYQHNDWNMPVGRWENIRKESGKLLADAVFDEDDTNEDVKRMIRKVEKGFIKMASCGLVDLVTAFNPLGDEYTVTKCRLREASIVAIGGNHNAIRLYDNQGVEIELSKDAGIKLADYIVKPKITQTMSKKYLQILNLSDTATDEMIGMAVQALQGDKEAAEARATKAETDLNALLLADKTAKHQAFATEVEAAIKGGQIDEKADGSVKASFLDLFDKSPEAARTALGALPKPKSLKGLELGDKDSKELKELEAMDYGAIDKGGKILLLRDKYPELYKEKFKAKFGKEPRA